MSPDAKIQETVAAGHYSGYEHQQHGEEAG